MLMYVILSHKAKKQSRKLDGRAMVTKLFILGRPGSGKSTIARYITKSAKQKGWDTTYYCDYGILWGMFQRELYGPRCLQQHFERVDHNGFRVIDFSVLDPALNSIQRRVNSALKDCNPNAKRLIVIEFARDNYIQAFRQFDPIFLQDAHFLFLDAKVDTCIPRIHYRAAHCESRHDDHFVSDDIIAGYYQKDSTPLMIRELAEVFDLNNQKMQKLQTDGLLDELLNDFVPDYTYHLLEQPSSAKRNTGPLVGAFPLPPLKKYYTTYCPSPSPDKQSAIVLINQPQVQIPATNGSFEEILIDSQILGATRDKQLLRK